MIPVELTLPWPPSVNNLFAGTKRRYATKHYRTWRRHAEMEIMAARTPRINGPVTISILLHPPDSRPRDPSNHVKAIEDTLVRMQVIRDDNGDVVKQISARWGAVASPSKRARAVVTITPI